jgi:exonuclease SbcD
VRFLHTGDWHVGKTLRGRSRSEEFAAALEQVFGIAREAKVDAVLVAGDVFDSPAPAPEAERLVYDFLARLLAEGIPAVLIAGNHDHPKKLAALARLLEGLRIHIRPEVKRPEQGGVVALASRDGRQQARIACLPFVPERRVFDARAVMGDSKDWYESYADSVARLLRALTADLTPATVNLALAHVLIAGARVGTGERPLHLGEVYGIDAQQLPAKLQYVGLGHLHRPQEVLAPSRTCYAGSLIELDFGEREQDKRVVVVEADPGGPARVESVPLSAGRKLRDVAGSPEELHELAAGVGDAYLRVAVRVVAPLPGLAERMRELFPNALEVKVEHPREVRVHEGRCDGLRRLSPEQLFADYCRKRDGAAPAPELAALFRRLHEEASQA